MDLMSERGPIKCSSELKKNMKTLVSYSTKFKNKKINNYDNQVKKDQVGIYERMNCKATENEFEKVNHDMGIVNKHEDQWLKSMTSDTFKTPLRENQTTRKNQTERK
jgi:hypothetical protein